MAEQTISRQQVMRQQVLMVTYALTVIATYVWAFWAWKYGNTLGIVVSFLATLGYLLSISNDCEWQDVSKNLWAWSMWGAALLSSFVFSPNFFGFMVAGTAGTGEKVWLVNGRPHGAWAIALPQIQRIEAVYTKNSTVGELHLTTSDFASIKVSYLVEYGVSSDPNKLAALAGMFNHPDQGLCDYFRRSIDRWLEISTRSMTLDQLDSKLKIETVLSGLADSKLNELGVRWGEDITVTDIKCWRKGELVRY